MSKVSSHGHSHDHDHGHATTTIRHKPQVLVAVANGSEELEAVTAIDVLVRGGADVVVGSVMPDLEVTCSRGVKLVANRFIKDCLQQNWDMIVLPGGMPGAVHLSECEDLTRLLHAQLESNRFVAAICASPAVVLANHHLIRNKQATCYPVEKFISKIANYSSESVVVDGHLITSQGPGTSLPFALTLVEALFGPETTASVKKELLFH